MAYKEIAKKDAQGSSQGCLYWCVASFKGFVYCRSCWSERIPSPYRDEQEDLPNRSWNSHKGWKSKCDSNAIVKFFIHTNIYLYILQRVEFTKIYCFLLLLKQGNLLTWILIHYLLNYTYIEITLNQNFWGFV